MPRHQRIHQRNTDSAADVAHQIEQAAGVADLFVPSVPTEMVESGTKTIPDPTPLRMMGQSSEDGEISSVRFAIQRLVSPKMTKPP